MNSSFVKAVAPKGLAHIPISLNSFPIASNDLVNAEEYSLESRHSSIRMFAQSELTDSSIHSAYSVAFSSIALSTTSLTYA